MGKLVRKDRPRVTPSDAESKLKSGTKSPVVKTTTFKAKSSINAQLAKKNPKISTTKSALFKFTKNADTNESAPEAVPILPASLPAVLAVKRQITKKEKIQNRHDNLMRKVNSALEAKRSIKLEAKRSVKLKAKIIRKEKKEKMQKVGQITKTTAQGVRAAMADMSQLKNALISLDDQLPPLNYLFQLKSKDLKTGVPKFDAKAKPMTAAASTGAPRKVSKTTNTLNKKNEFMQRYNHFQKLSNDKTFKMNPRQVIAAHIRNRQAQQI